MLLRMPFSTFIRQSVEEILDEGERFMRARVPAAQHMSPEALRDDGLQMLLAIAADMQTAESEAERSSKSQRLASSAPGEESAAAKHGAARQAAGFDLVQLVGEFRAMRASVLLLWSRSPSALHGVAAAEEIARFNEAIDEALAHSVQRYSSDMDRSRDMFLAVLGHDVRGPLSGIGLGTEILIQPNLAEATRIKVAMRMRRAVDLVSRLTTDLLEFTRTRLGHSIPVSRTPGDLLPCCVQVLETLTLSHPEQTFESDLSGTLEGDFDLPRMQQVLINLLNNAIQHGSRGSSVRLSAHGDEEHVVLEVSNWGQPIPKEALPVIFDPLVQGKSGESSQPGSLGLGLYIVKEIVQEHGGTVSVQSSLEDGTTFTVRLPRAGT